MRSKAKRNFFTGVKVIIAALLIVLQVYPIFYVITSSMKTTDDFQKPAILRTAEVIKF